MANTINKPEYTLNINNSEIQYNKGYTQNAARVENNFNVHYPIGNPLVPHGTALHVTELFLQFLKIVFEDVPADYPYKYIENDFENSRIAFDVNLNKESEIYGKRPIVIVSRGQQSTTPTEIGDLALSNFRNNFKVGSNLYTSSINFQVVSSAKAECEIVAQNIFSVLMFYRTHLPKILNLHMVESIMLSEVDKMEDDDTIFTVQGAVNYLGQCVWTQSTNTPLLKSTGIRLDTLAR